MADRAVSDHPAVQAQLERLDRLSPGRDILGLERITALLGRLGNPERRLPPVLHVAGTNGKGSTCAFLRAALEAAGLSTHVYTSPHLVRLNERIRLAGRLIEDDALAVLLEETLDAATAIAPTFFEATTAAALLGFSRAAAHALIVEVGFGGGRDATNVFSAPAACGIAEIGLDHRASLGGCVEAVAAEKAGIAKAGVPLVTLSYPAPITEQIGRIAAAANAIWLPCGGQWQVRTDSAFLRYCDAAGELVLPLPRLHGRHQTANAALAVAMIRHQSALAVPDHALIAAMMLADWPARLQLLADGPLLRLLRPGSELWLDGGHNPAAAFMVADFFHSCVPKHRPFHVVLGLLERKNAAGVLEPFASSRPVIHAIPVPGHASHDPAALAAKARAMGLSARAAPDLKIALESIGSDHGRAGTEPPVVLVFGSLFLAGESLRANRQPPT